MPLRIMPENEIRPVPQRLGMRPPIVEPTNMPIHTRGRCCMDELYTDAEAFSLAMNGSDGSEAFTGVRILPRASNF